MKIVAALLFVLVVAAALFVLIPEVRRDAAQVLLSPPPSAQQGDADQSSAGPNAFDKIAEGIKNGFDKVAGAAANAVGKPLAHPGNGEKKVLADTSAAERPSESHAAANRSAASPTQAAEMQPQPPVTLKSTLDRAASTAAGPKTTAPPAAPAAPVPAVPLRLPRELSHLRFGMSPADIEAIYGIRWDSNNTQNWKMQSQDELVYVHYLTADKTQELRFSFAGGSLYQIQVRLKPTDPQGLNALYERLQKSYAEQYKNVKEAGLTRWSDGTVTASISKDSIQNCVKLVFICPSARR